MANARRPRLARIHAWTGVLVALPLFLIALTGGCLLFRDEIFVPYSWRYTPEQLSQAAFDEESSRLVMQDALQHVDSIQLARGARAFHAVTNIDGTRSYWRFGANQPEVQVPLRLRLEPWVLELHEHLLLGVTGDILVRTIGPLVAVLMIVGFVLWWPLRTGWRARDLLPRSLSWPQLLRAHLALGAAAGLLFVTHASTGAMMANNPSIRAWLEPLTDPSAAVLPAATSRDFPVNDAKAALAALRSIFPRGEITELSRGGSEPGSAWSLKLRLPGENHPNGRSNITLDLTAGHVDSIRDARKAGVPGTYDDIVFALHVGVLFGWGQRFVWIAGALGLAALIVAGSLSFIRRPAKNSRRR